MSGAANVTIAVPAALGAAASFGLGAAVQHRQARLTPAAVPTRGERVGALRLLARLARQPLWLAGIALTIAGYGLQATALAFGPLTLVAPIVAADLMFALPVAARWARRPLTSRDWLGCVLTAGGIGVFLVTAPESSGRSDAPAQDWLLAFGAVALICVAVTALGRRLRSRAVTTAVAAGLIYGLTAAVTLSLTRLARAEGPWRALAHWQPWALAGLGLAGLALTMGAFQAGALGASLPVIDTVEPVSGVLIGTFVFGEHLAATPAGLGAQAVAAAAAVTGITLLGLAAPGARSAASPAVNRKERTTKTDRTLVKGGPGGALGTPADRTLTTACTSDSAARGSR
jgi:drug/metabolite transporter (DMT)-like permease